MQLLQHGRLSSHFTRLLRHVRLEKVSQKGMAVQLNAQQYSTLIIMLQRLASMNKDHTHQPVEVLNPRDLDGIAECGENGVEHDVATSRIDARELGSTESRDDWKLARYR